ncbi:MAG: glycoside hydrolase family 26 protein, partial [Oscillospiraceae bacterium]|nr:glycoside hydrolase family 26 protein [Oscillospiraceae bacterium]
MKRLIALLAACFLLLAACSSPSAEPSLPAEGGREWIPPSPKPSPSPEVPIVREPYVMDENLPKLRNPNATEEAQAVYNYLNSVYKLKTLTGQQESTWMGTPDYEMNYLKELTGELPAIRGLDYISSDYAGVNERSIEWWNKGGLVSICWHWGRPPDGSGYDSSKVKIDVTEALTEGTELNIGMMEYMDKTAAALKELQDAGVPVLWRPFHEFDGGWFWWGADGADNFIKLWQLMYDRYTNHHGLNNLIWVLGYADNVKNGWYPGDEYVDIAGADTYSNGTRLSTYKKLVNVFGEERPIAFHECGRMPDINKAHGEGALWSWFLTWHTEYLIDYNPEEHIQTIYGSEYAVTFDMLPSFGQ